MTYRTQFLASERLIRLLTLRFHQTYNLKKLLRHKRLAVLVAAGCASLGLPAPESDLGYPRLY